MERHEGIRVDAPERQITRRRETSEAPAPAPEAVRDTPEVEKKIIGLLEVPVGLVERLPIEQVSYLDDEPTLDHAPDVFDDQPEAAPSGFLGRLGSSRWAKALGIAGLFGASIEAANAFQNAGEQLAESREEIATEVHTIALQSRLDRAMTGLTHAVDLPHANNEALHELNADYTENAKEAGLYDFLKGQCAADSATLAIEDCYLIYGDQLKLSAEGEMALAQATGNSVEKNAFIGEVIRKSVFIRGGGFGAIAPMGRYHGDQIADSFTHERDALFKDHLETAKILTSTAVDALDLMNASSTEQADAKENLAFVIRSEIDLTNALTHVSHDFADINDSIQQEKLLEGIENMKGEKISDMTTLDLTEFQHSSSWKKLLTIESDANGVLHEIAAKMSGEQRTQRLEMFTEAARAGVLPEFFAEQTKTTD